MIKKKSIAVKNKVTVKQKGVNITLVDRIELINNNIERIHKRFLENRSMITRVSLLKTLVYRQKLMQHLYDADISEYTRIASRIGGIYELD